MTKNTRNAVQLVVLYGTNDVLRTAGKSPNESENYKNPVQSQLFDLFSVLIDLYLWEMILLILLGMFKKPTGHPSLTDRKMG